MIEPTHLVVGPGEPDNERFGELLRQFRMDVELSRAEVANILGFSSEFLRLIELGKRTPAHGNMPAIFDTYRVDYVLDPGVVTFGDYFVQFTSRIQEPRQKGSMESVNHPSHYGGDTVYEAIKVIEAWELDFHLGNAVKYISRAGKKDPAKELEDLHKAQWYLNRRITQLEEG